MPPKRKPRCASCNKIIKGRPVRVHVEILRKYVDAHPDCAEGIERRVAELAAKPRPPRPICEDCRRPMGAGEARIRFTHTEGWTVTGHVSCISRLRTLYGPVRHGEEECPVPEPTTCDVCGSPVPPVTALGWRRPDGSVLHGHRRCVDTERRKPWRASYGPGVDEDPEQRRH